MTPSNKLLFKLLFIMSPIIFMVIFLLYNLFINNNNFLSSIMNALSIVAIYYFCISLYFIFFNIKDDKTNNM
ncbi:magnesium-transporting ATPase (P-type) [Scopulibacillus daqui]|uniref:Magnesium-transporting ATPase (P-type) n=1 Tax=Scopulibacillus daqui TaxID=1469162 RepID=A0ABS2PY33_9BACL|nr:magnesium-transporting ATPase (P-type) [Scopulibacillus daqui]